MKRGFLIVFVLLTGCWQGVARGVKVCWEAEDAEEIEFPMAILSNRVEGASGAYLEIPEGAGNPPKMTKGKAVYTFEVPESGNYILWARVWWADECGNSFTVRIDGSPPFIFGEDATYRCWHWVRYPVSRTSTPLRLAEGTHTLTFHNREDGVRLDQILLSADRRFVPAGIESAGIRP